MNNPKSASKVPNQTPPSSSIYLTMEDLGLRLDQDQISLVENIPRNIAGVEKSININPPQVPVIEVPRGGASDNSELQTQVSDFLQNAASPEDMRQIAAIIASAKATHEPIASRTTHVDSGYAPSPQLAGVTFRSSSDSEGDPNNVENYGGQSQNVRPGKIQKRSDFFSSSSEEEETLNRAKDESWPHPLAKLIGQNGCSSQIISEAREDRELVTHHRDFVRERTKNLRRACFPTSRVGWHNGLLAIRLAQIQELLGKSVLAGSKTLAFKAILNLSEVENIPVVDISQAKRWISNERKLHVTLSKMIKDCSNAADHESNIARVVEKDGYWTVAAFEGSAEFNSAFKRHLEYVKRESSKETSGSRSSASNFINGHFKGTAPSFRGVEDKRKMTRAFSGGRHYRELRPALQNFRPKEGPSVQRPCAVCKSPDHWVNMCPHRGK
ncbi:uncharacterized protein LOC131892591 [Tigriopus californicus]|uniref:uncharacterized protein LOC131892591 n=1 Tax=Tigriopus californicus TaxID=6832 RepID=UPI0027DAB065|nr:uncharacterized protein LOC131892591 [Tigriopus californicus]